MKIQPIIINGLPQSGKDTVIGLIKDYCSKKFTFKTYSSVDPIKAYMVDNLGWDGEKTSEARDLISHIKRFWSDNCNGPNRYLIGNMIEICKQAEFDEYMEDFVIVFQIREIEEINNLVFMIDAMSSYYTQFQKCKIVTVIRDVCNRDIQTNDSDNINIGVMKEMSDYVIWNNSTLSILDAEVNEMMSEFTKNMEYYTGGF